jgi:hypothetical protein
MRELLLMTRMEFFEGILEERSIVAGRQVKIAYSSTSALGQYQPV